MHNRFGLNGIKRERSVKDQGTEISNFYPLKDKDTKVLRLDNARRGEKSNLRDVQKRSSKMKKSNRGSGKRGQNIVVGSKRVKIDRGFPLKRVAYGSSRNFRDYPDPKESNFGNKILNSDFSKCEKKREEPILHRDVRPKTGLLGKRRSLRGDLGLVKFEGNPKLKIPILINLEDDNIFESCEIYKTY